VRGVWLSWSQEQGPGHPEGRHRGGGERALDLASGLRDTTYCPMTGPDVTSAVRAGRMLEVPPAAVGAFYTVSGG